MYSFSMLAVSGLSCHFFHLVLIDCIKGVRIGHAGRNLIRNPQGCCSQETEHLGSYWGLGLRAIASILVYADTAGPGPDNKIVALDIILGALQ